MRATLYLLAAALFDVPRQEQRETLHGLLRQVIYRSPLEARWVSPLMEVADAMKRRASLDTEYARLFLLAQPRVIAQPYGSFWLEADRRLMGETTLQVAALMRRHGVMPAPDSGLLPDHLVSELEFMAYLADREAEEETRATQQMLLHDHLAAWVPPFVDALLGCAPPRFYRMAARYLQEVIAWDRHDFITTPPFSTAAV